MSQRCMKNLKELPLDRKVTLHTQAGAFTGYIAESEFDTVTLFTYEVPPMKSKADRTSYTHVPVSLIVAWTDLRDGAGTPITLNFPG